MKDTTTFWEDDPDKGIVINAFLFQKIYLTMKDNIERAEINIVGEQIIKWMKNKYNIKTSTLSTEEGSELIAIPRWMYKLIYFEFKEYSASFNYTACFNILNVLSEMGYVLNIE